MMYCSDDSGGHRVPVDRTRIHQYTEDVVCSITQRVRSMIENVVGDLDALDVLDENTLRAASYRIKTDFQDFSQKLENHVLEEMCAVGKQVVDMYERIDQLHAERGLPRFIIDNNIPLRAMIPILQQQLAILEGGSGGDQTRQGFEAEQSRMERERQDQIRIDKWQERRIAVERAKQLEHERQQILQMTAQLQQEERNLCYELGEEPTQNVPLSDEGLDSLVGRVQDLKSMKLERQGEVEECSAAVRDMMQALGRSPECGFEIAVSQGFHPKLTGQNLEKMQRLRSQYKGMMQRETDECNALRIKVHGLWDRLGEDQTRRTAFMSQTRGIRPSVKRQLAVEAARCEEELNVRAQRSIALPGVANRFGFGRSQLPRPRPSPVALQTSRAASPNVRLARQQQQIASRQLASSVACGPQQPALTPLSSRAGRAVPAKFGIARQQHLPSTTRPVCVTNYKQRGVAAPSPQALKPKIPRTNKVQGSGYGTQRR